MIRESDDYTQQINVKDSRYASASVCLNSAACLHSRVKHKWPTKVVTIEVTELGVGQPYYVLVPPTAFHTLIFEFFPGFTTTEGWEFITTGHSLA